MPFEWEKDDPLVEQPTIQPWEADDPIAVPSRESYGVTGTWEEDDPMSLPARFGERLYNIIPETIKGILQTAVRFSPGRVEMMQQAEEEILAGTLGPKEAERAKKRAEKRQQQAQFLTPTEIPPATTVGEKATDVAAGVTGFVTKLALLKKAYPNIGGAALWEMENLSSGGTPGIGAATYGVFSLPGKAIKGVTVAAKAGRIASESVLLGGMSATHQKIETGEINASEVLISAGIPLGLRAVGGAKGVLKRALKAKNPKAIRAANETIIKQQEIPPGSNVYKTKKGRVVIEKPGDIGTKQGTVMRDGRIYERGTNVELFPAPELSVSAIVAKPITEKGPITKAEREILREAGFTIEEIGKAKPSELRAVMRDPTKPIEAPAGVRGETITGVASRFRGKIFTGATHYETWKAAAKSVGKEDLSYSRFVGGDATYRDGFITSTGRFVNRNEATKIADAAKQPRDRTEAEISHTDLTPVEGIEGANQKLIAWSGTAKHLRKTEVKAAHKALRQRQVSRGIKATKAAIKAGKSAGEAIRAGRRAYGGKAKVVKVTPPDLTDAQWESYHKKIFEIYPLGNKRTQFKITGTQDVLDKLRAGDIPTDYDFGFLDKLLGRETTLQLHKNLIKPRTYSLMDAPWIARDMLKTTFAYDPQAARQFSGVTARHPKITAEALVANKQAYIGKGILRRLGRRVLRRDIKGIETGKQAATRIDAAIESMPEHKLAKNYMTFLENTPWKTHKAGTKLQQYGGVSDFLLSRKSKVLRKWGEVIAASERGANSGINLGMQKLWNESEKELALRIGRKGMTPTQIEKWRVQRGKEILTGIKRRTAVTKQGKQIQRAANWFLFSPANTWSRLIQPLNVISGLARGQGVGGRTYAAQLLVTNIAKISAMGSIAAYTGHRLRANNPTEAPHIDGSNDPTNSMWGKTRVGNDTFDPSGGDAPTYRMFARLGVSAYMYARKEITGKEGTVRPPGEVFMNWLNSRETVLIGLAKTLATGKDWLGQPIGRTEALLKAFPIEFIVSVVEAGGADGLWENLAEEGDIQEASKTFIKNIPVGLAGLAAGIGTATYPVRTTTTRQKFRDIIAKKEHDKSWDNLTLIEQRKLSIKHRKAFDMFERKIKVERIKEPYDPSRIIEEQRKSEIKIRKLLSKTNRKKVETISVKVSRRPKNFFLNDEKYQQYQELTAKYLNERLSKLKLDGKSEKVRTKMLEMVIKLAKNKAFRDIRRAMR